MSNFKNTLTLNDIPVSLITHTHDYLTLPGILSQLDYLEALTLSSTTSQTWQTKLNLNFTLSVLSDVVISWTGSIYNNLANRRIFAQVIVDNTNIVYTFSARESLTNVEKPIIGFSPRLSLSSGSHNVKLQYKNGPDGGTCYIYNTSISVSLIS